MHPLIYDSQCVVGSYFFLEVHHVYREANSATDLMATYVAEHSGQMVWTKSDDLPSAFKDILLSDLFGCIHIRFV